MTICYWITITLSTQHNAARRSFTFTSSYSAWWWRRRWFSMFDVVPSLAATLRWHILHSGNPSSFKSPSVFLINPKYFQTGEFLRLTGGWSSVVFERSSLCSAPAGAITCCNRNRFTTDSDKKIQFKPSVINLKKLDQKKKKKSVTGWCDEAESPLLPGSRRSANQSPNSINEWVN